MADWRASVIALAEAHAIPGLSIAVVKPSSEDTLYHGLCSGYPVDERTWFQAASTGKHVTACAVLDQAARGVVDLKAGIGCYLPDAPAAWQNRTIFSLLRHTSGLPEYLEYSENEVVPRDRADFMARYAALKPIAAEGEAWGYSNTNYILLGFLIAEIAKRSYGAVVNDLMAHPGATVASPDWVRAANRHQLGPSARDSESMTRQVIGDGDIAFTAPGGLAWLKKLLATKGALFEPAILATGRSAPYACGWFVEQMGAADLAHHAGHYDGWTAMAFLNRTMNTGVVALCNLAPGNTRAIRAAAQCALEGFAPGSTPLMLHVIHDREPDVTAMVRQQLFRKEGDTIDRNCFAPELQTAIDKGGPIRGVINLYTGEEPRSFELVETRNNMRRYRLSYATRTEHLSVGLTDDYRIYWAWPL